mmetsp:Transcript_325/g.479  ORF Transcript_325/g.479 Transcript_325/m.479 type:complete len:98 (-) Transcript_325:29-322(-)
MVRAEGIDGRSTLTVGTLCPNARGLSSEHDESKSISVCLLRSVSWRCPTCQSFLKRTCAYKTRTRNTARHAQEQYTEGWRFKCINRPSLVMRARVDP